MRLPGAPGSSEFADISGWDLRQGRTSSAPTEGDTVPAQPGSAVNPFRSGRRWRSPTRLHQLPLDSKKRPACQGNCRRTCALALTARGGVRAPGVGAGRGLFKFLFSEPHIDSRDSAKFPLHWQSCTASPFPSSPAPRPGTARRQMRAAK